MVRFIKTLVDIPEDKGIHIKSAGVKGEKYVYKYVKYFRNANGEPRNKAKAIGKIDIESGKMLPNKYYFETYNVESSFANITSWDYGYSYTVLKICRDIGLLDCLSAAFGDGAAMDIIVMAAYIIREGNAMDGIDDWLQRNYFKEYDRLLCSQSTSKIFASLTSGKRDAFFTEWVKRQTKVCALGKETVCYDVTSISSYSDNIPSVERGYNRDGENLSQFNLGMFCNERTKIPLYYNRYNGSLTDKTNLSHVLANAKEVGIERVKMVLDGGFWSEECLCSLKDFCCAFTLGMPLYLKESEKILAAHGQGIEKYVNELSKHHIYCVPVHTQVCGIPGRVLLYYDPQNHLNQCAQLSSYINRLKEELKTLKRYPKGKRSRYTPYFVLTKHEQDSGFDYHVDEQKVESIRKLKGFFLIFSTDMESSAQDILEYYRAKDADEKIFAQIKAHMDGNRIRTHNEQTTDGKTFVTFIACVIRAYFQNRLSQYLHDYSTSMKKVFNQLSNISVISSNGCFRFNKALTKTQKLILSALDASQDIGTSI